MIYHYNQLSIFTGLVKSQSLFYILINAYESLLIVYKVNLLDNPHCPLFVNTWINGIPEIFQSPTFEHLSQILI